MSSVPITKRGAELLKEELIRLKTKERPAVIRAIAEARAHGDLSENAEYDAAKERQSFVEVRIADLEGKLGAAQVIDPVLLDAEGRIVFASTVHLEDLESGEKVTYQIVGIDEADLKESKVSITSPIARALIGKYAGDVVEEPLGVGQRRGWLIENEQLDAFREGLGDFNELLLSNAELEHLGRRVFVQVDARMQASGMTAAQQNAAIGADLCLGPADLPGRTAHRNTGRGWPVRRTRRASRCRCREEPCHAPRCRTRPAG